MARKKISEYRAKKLVYEILGVEYRGVAVGPEEAFSIQSLVSSLKTDSTEAKVEDKLYVVKVDQGVKKRGKQGLVKVKLSKEDIPYAIQELQAKGFQYFIIEEFIPHEPTEEKYLALSRTREGIEVLYSNKGGIEIEENEDSIKHIVIPVQIGIQKAGEIASQNENARNDRQKILKQVQDDIRLNGELLNNIILAFEKYHFSFLELNPFLIYNSQFLILDAAVEVDSAAEFFVKDAWTSSDFRDYSTHARTDEEKNIAKLSEQSQASFSLSVLNPDGAIWMLLSGGGASIVLADEAYNRGYGNEVGNYGEYSGNPNAQETYYYTKQVLNLLIKSCAKKKVLIIGGGVANFTDVAKTFKGVILAIGEVADKLKYQGVKVFVRRGGPNQEEGLKNMKEFLEKNGLYGQVCGPDMVLVDIMSKALEKLN